MRQLLKQHGKLLKLDFNAREAIIFVRFKTWIPRIEDRKDKIKQAIFDTVGVDFEVTITSENITPIEDNSREERLLEQIQLTRRKLPPNQFLIGRGWLPIINAQED
ncbi:MAG: hypothetical protein F6K24_01935 [Okeania sp. SIO2D1]|nr:hypothetical protein [Okeania sp. SIO2D1]